MSTQTQTGMPTTNERTRHGALSRVSEAAGEAKRIAASAGALGVRSTVRHEARQRGVAVTSEDGVTDTLVAASQVGGVNLIGVMFAIIMAAAIGMVGTTVISSIDQSIDQPEGSKYQNASDSIASGFANAMGLTDIVFLVLMFVVVIGALFLARRAQGGM
ncbi:hypothetical protein [Halobacterium sp. CBA1126]|uniref:hypothetical protein n=1 Tax=Halobacterium sp. CBA1126 TaxID=2668074 RepID=UPI0012FCA007|nr:hypothetical protein [Halobacterium sp. CBA1126]MUV59781.1 hypothetical protein [Halobacterium sp. CBA1126]